MGRETAKLIYLDGPCPGPFLTCTPLGVFLLHLFGRQQSHEEAAPSAAPAAEGWGKRNTGTSTDVLVVFFSDIKGSTALKESLAKSREKALAL